MLKHLNNDQKNEEGDTCFKIKIMVLQASKIVELTQQINEQGLIFSQSFFRVFVVVVLAFLPKTHIRGLESVNDREC